MAAVASYLDARAHQGQWLVRMEDVDTGRAVPGAADEILRALEQFGFCWDGEVLWQSQRTHRYLEALERLRAQGVVFDCGCSRKDLVVGGWTGEESQTRYPGICRNGLPAAYLAAGRTARSVRFRVDDDPIRFVDRLQGVVESHLESSIGDFVILRADGLFAYQLAVVVDDAEQGITDIVRGADLLDNTPRQIALQRALGYPTPRYLHVPVAVFSDGSKLSKQTGAAPLRQDRAVKELCAALQFLGQTPPIGLSDTSLAEIWAWAQTQWRPEAIPATESLPASEMLLELG